ncbi:MAG: hypothetical protein ACFFDW_10485 [Candidatus Thorarchaeota archaeon]
MEYAIFLREQANKPVEALTIFLKLLRKEANNQLMLNEILKTIGNRDYIYSNEINSKDLHLIYNLMKQVPQEEYNDTQYLEGCAKILTALELNNEMIQIYDRLIELNPSKPDYWLNLGQAIGERDLLAQLNCCKNALKLDPENPHIIIEIGKFLESIFLKNIAQKFYEIALEIAPSFELAAEKLLGITEKESEDDVIFTHVRNSSYDLFEELDKVKKFIR